MSPDRIKNKFYNVYAIDETKLKTALSSMYVSPTSIPLFTSSLHKHNHEMSIGVQLLHVHF